MSLLCTAQEIFYGFLFPTSCWCVPITPSGLDPQEAAAQSPAVWVPARWVSCLPCSQCDRHQPSTSSATRTHRTFPFLPIPSTAKNKAPLQDKPETRKGSSPRGNSRVILQCQQHREQCSTPNPCLPLKPLPMVLHPPSPRITGLRQMLGSPGRRPGPRKEGKH